MLVENLRVPQWRAFLAGTLMILDFSTGSSLWTRTYVGGVLKDLYLLLCCRGVHREGLQ